MATNILDTGEAYLSAADKQFARVAIIPVHIQSPATFAVSPAITCAVVGVALAGLAVAALVH